MAVVAEFTIPPEAVPGGRALEDLQDVTVELERIVPTTGAALPFFWVFGEDAETFVERFGADPEIDDLEVLERLDGAILVKAAWRPDSAAIRGIQRLRATIMEATGTAEEWRFRVRGESRERLDEFRRLFTESDIPVRLERIYNYSEIAETERPLTDEQRETLLAAYRKGYFEQPRRVTQAELADEFGISTRAVSNRLRLGTRNLVAGTLVEPGEGAGE